MDHKMLISLFALFLCVVGSSGCTYLNNDSLNESDVQLPDGWTFNKTNTALSYDTGFVWLTYDYNSKLSVVIYEYNQSQYDNMLAIENDETSRKNITIEGINVKIMKKSYYNDYNIGREDYLFKKNGKYYEVKFGIDAEGRDTSITENIYRAEIDDALKSIIKTI